MFRLTFSVSQKVGVWCSLLVVLICVVRVATAAAQEIVDEWRYTIRAPAENWHDVAFDDSSWKTGWGGFGARGTPHARVGTPWTTNDIWLRKSFLLDSIPEKPALLIHHDEDAEVYINGESVLAVSDFSRDYSVVPLPQPKVSALRVGKNVMAVHCRQRRGGQFIDVHLVDATRVPNLPPPKRSTRPFQSKLITKWGEAVTPQNAWTEYPRPQLQRSDWNNLNGNWDYAVTSADQTSAPAEWEGQILVPFCLESKLSGVQRLLDPNEALWYRRTFVATKEAGNRQLLNFEAVDYSCEVFINGIVVGTHRGGYTPFSFDITDALKNGTNELLVKIQDATDGYQLRGKQSLDPHGIWYTQVSGIWQTVWTEKVSANYVEGLKIVTDAGKGTISLRLIIEGEGTIHVVVKDEGQVVAEESSAERDLVLSIPNAKLWSPDSPHLYDIEVALLDSDDDELDRVKSYAGIRTIGKIMDAEGNWRFALNGKKVFHWGTLDQGWWPDGLLTPPSDEAMAIDVQWLKDAGYNMIRKHVKVEPRRYYYHCDRLGMMVWQDHVSGGKSPRTWSRLEPGPRDALWPDQDHRQFMQELEGMINTLENHPSIVVWVPFNEHWGQHRTMQVGKWLKKRDPQRLVNIASGGNFWPVGDIVDAHKYPDPAFPFAHGIGGRFGDYIKVMGEFGGHGYPVRGHLWDQERRNWGYGGLPNTKAEYKKRYVKSLSMLNDLRRQGIAGGVYTQTTDVEGEINGLMTYDRKAAKIPAQELAQLHQVLFSTVSSKQEVVEPNPDFRAQKTDRKPAPVMSADTIGAGLQSRDRALYIKAGWIRDPYITLGPDDYYYLTGTQPNPGDPRESEDPYNVGLGIKSIVGEHVRVWRSKDLIEWDSLGAPFSLDDTVHASKLEESSHKRVIWAPELHWLGNRWALVHCPRNVASLALTEGAKLQGPWTHPMGTNLGQRHDPSLFQDDDGTVYLLWANTFVAPLSRDLSRYTAEPVRIDPAGSRPGPDGTPISRIGHEGATMIKVGGKYVHLGTAWSTDMGRKGSYNLYYCVSDKITGPYGPRQFAGRFLGHGTPFQDRNGSWWCTAFFNANVPPLPREGIQQRDLSENAQTINEQGVTIVPLDVRILDSGDIYIRAKDPAYATPGPDEAQDFATSDREEQQDAVFLPCHCRRQITVTVPIALSC